MIDLGSIAGLYEHDHKPHAYCLRCDRWRVLDLSNMVRQGKGTMRLPISVHCHECAGVGRLQVRPPVPTRGTGGWGESPLPA